MGEKTSIAWCDHTFNPWIGCTKISDGCKFCYAETLMDGRWGKAKWGPKGTRKRTSESYWRQPHLWNAEAQRLGVRRRVFCASLADVFEGPETMPKEAWEGVEDARCDLWLLIEETAHLDWLILTKRPDNVIPLWLTPDCESHNYMYAGKISLPPNVWLGTSIEDSRVLKRVDDLRAIPASVRFLSIEPLIGPVSDRLDLTGIHWAIIGGESGQNARPCDVQEIHTLVQLAREHSVAPFVKQLGSKPVDRFSDVPVKILDSKGGNWVGYEDLRIHEYPTPEVVNV